MKVLHLSTSDINGGAARAAFRLHSGLLQLGIDSKMFVRNKSSENESIIRYKYPVGLKKLGYRLHKSIIIDDFKKYLPSRPKGLETFSDDRSFLKYGFDDQLPYADIYHLHWISGFVDLPSFFRKIKSPVVWTLHDMFPFTGGCHYNNGCDKFKMHCNKCPQLGSSLTQDLSYQIWERKRKFIDGFKGKLVIRADSHWLADQARQSKLFGDFDIKTIHYGIDTDEFVIRDKMACRKALNIPHNKRVLVFGAPGVENPRKGFVQLVEAMNILDSMHSELFLLSFGSGPVPGQTSIPGIHFGHISDNRLLSVIYNCADVFVIPSLQEAFGQTSLEAMSCGIPVVGFNTGGIPDMIEDGVTGFLAETGNVKELANALNNILDLDLNKYNEMSINCRTKVLAGFNLITQAKHYMNIYHNLI